MRATGDPEPRRPGEADLLGVVLCGGESRRMGSDKGLLRGAEGRPWALLMGDKLRECGLSVVYSIHQRQLAAYSAIISQDQLIIDSEAWPGPLNGLFTTFRRFPGLDLLLVACDMPDLDADTLSRIIAVYRSEESDFYAYEAAGFLQPFCGIYTAAALKRAEATLRENSLRGLLQTGAIRRLKGEPAAFRNYNSL